MLIKGNANPEDVFKKLESLEKEISDTYNKVKKLEKELNL
jgi:peptidoglycan hydrolase CwlO-like protein